MNKKLKEKLLEIAKEKIPKTDVSHDFEHAQRVLNNAEKIAKKEKGDRDILIPAALFHDIIVYPKNHPKAHLSQEKSAEATKKILQNISEFPKEKIKQIIECIRECSFGKGITPTTKESKILQDADKLEATGAIIIMRTFASCGQMQRTFYNPSDPFCKKREPNKTQYALDLFYERWLKVPDRMHTKTGKKIAKRRTAYLHEFLKEVKLEIEGK